jgi:hypothetical protein
METGTEKETETDTDKDKDKNIESTDIDRNTDTERDFGKFCKVFNTMTSLFPKSNTAIGSALQTKS